MLTTNEDRVQMRIDLVVRYAEMRRDAGQNAEKLEAARQWALENGLQFGCSSSSKRDARVVEHRRSGGGEITRCAPIDYDRLAGYLLTGERTKEELFAFAGQKSDGGKLFNVKWRLQTRGYRFCSRPIQAGNNRKVYWVERVPNQVSGEQEADGKKK